MKFIDTVYFPKNSTLERYCNSHSYFDYPQKVFFSKKFEYLVCEDITILYGNNGSGKSTVLNIIGEKIGALRNKPIFKDVKYNESQFYEEYHPFEDFLNNTNVSFDINVGERQPTIKKVITSDDIFSLINKTIVINNTAVDEISNAKAKRDEILDEGYSFKSMDDYDKLVRLNEARKLSGTQYADKYASHKKQMHSNGETALDFFGDIFEENGVYLLDEPENCLSPTFQIQLMKLIVEASRFLNCQFIIATHSPLLLSLPGAKVYNLDKTPVISEPWYELENVKIYFDFFFKNKDKFLK